MSNFSDFIGSSGGGGLAIESQVGAITYLNKDDDLIITDDGQHWLKAGVTVTDNILYPDAKSTLTGSLGTVGVNEVVLSNTTNWDKQGGQATDGKWIWNVDAYTNTIYKRRMDGSEYGQAIDMTDYPVMTGSMHIYVHGGYMWAIRAHAWSAWGGDYYHYLWKFQINAGNGTLHSTQQLDSYAAIYSAWGQNIGYNNSSSYITIMAGGQANNPGTHIYRTSKNSSSIGHVKVLPAGKGDPGPFFVFNGYIYLMNGSTWYKYSTDWVWQETITNMHVDSTGGSSWNYFSKQDTLASPQDDSFDGFVSGSTSGFGNEGQRLYGVTATGYVSFEPASAIGLSNARNVGAGTNQYVRIK